MSEALEAGRNGEVWGVIHFGQNFTEEYEIRQSLGDSAKLENILRSRISINIDSSSELILKKITRKYLLRCFFLFRSTNRCVFKQVACRSFSGFFPRFIDSLWA